MFVRRAVPRMNGWAPAGPPIDQANESKTFGDFMRTTYCGLVSEAL
ncbi:MAG: hypothetical protein JWP52_2166, partial [Rhizobacter sp.]|nr:hypothetical protein [Rhizobacter sp.]